MHVLQIIGNIGSGKSTLLEKLRNKDGYKNRRVVYEPVKKGILDIYYADPKLYAFAIQAFFENYYWSILSDLYDQEILDKSEALINVSNAYDFEKKIKEKEIQVLTDYGVTEVFTMSLYKQGLLTNREDTMLRELFAAARKRFSDKIEIDYIYVQESPKTCLERIAKRGRECEKSITLEYLMYLHECYEKFARDKGEHVVVVKDVLNL